MSCNSYTMEHGHPCRGAQEYGCKTVYTCTREDGMCEGSTRCSDCVSEQMLEQEQRRRERERAEWE